MESAVETKFNSFKKTSWKIIYVEEEDLFTFLVCREQGKQARYHHHIGAGHFSGIGWRWARQETLRTVNIDKLWNIFWKTRWPLLLPYSDKRNVLVYSVWYVLSMLHILMPRMWEFFLLIVSEGPGSSKDCTGSSFWFNLSTWIKYLQTEEVIFEVFVGLGQKEKNRWMHICSLSLFLAEPEFRSCTILGCLVGSGGQSTPSLRWDKDFRNAIL